MDQQITTTDLPEHRLCSHCGAQNRKEAKFCTICGQPMDTFEQSSPLSSSLSDVPPPIPESSAQPQDQLPSLSSPSFNPISRLALAIWKAEHNQPAAAQRIFQELLSFNPTDVTFRMTYAAFLAGQKDWIAAKQELEQAVSNDIEASSGWLNNQLENTPEAASLMYLQALLQTQLGQYEEAQATFAELLIVVPGHSQILVDQATLLEAMGRWDAAEHAYQSALQIEPDNVTWLIAYGTFLEGRGRDKEALHTLEQVLEVNPNNQELQTRVAALKKRINREEDARKQAALAKYKLDVQNDVDGAATQVAEALQLAPECALAHRVQADILERKGFLARAEAHLTRAIELEPDNSEYQTYYQAFQTRVEPKRQRVQQLVSQAQVATDSEVARAWLNESLELIADDIESHVAYAVSLWPDQPDEVEGHLRAALEVDPQHPEANRRLIMLLLAQNRMSEVEQYFQTVLERQPQDDALMDEYTGWLIDQGRYQEAVNRLQSALETLPSSGRLQGRLAIALARAGQLTEALLQFETALQMESQNGMLHFEYAMALRRRQEWVKAEEHFHQALKLNSNAPAVHCEYAALLLEQQRYSEAQHHIQQALYLNPGDEKTQAVARMIEEQLRQFEPVEEKLAYAVFLSKQGAIAEARQAFEHVLPLDQNNILILREYGIFLEGQGELDQAKVILEKALEIGPGNFETKKVYIGILRKKAVSLETKGELEQAEAILRKALEIMPEDQELETYYDAILTTLQEPITVDLPPRPEETLPPVSPTVPSPSLPEPKSQTDTQKPNALEKILRLFKLKK